MATDIALSAALRNNLLSLQNTQRLIDSVQLRLATGLKVNSALDGPQAFFTSQSLNNRASDLSRLLDGLGQSIQTIQTADKGVTALSTLVDQAESLAQEAASAVDEAGEAATITGNVDLRNIADLTTVSGIATTNFMTFSFVDPDHATPGTAVSLDTNFDDGGAGGRVTITSFESTDQILAQINGLRDTQGNQVVEASLTEKGYLKLKALTGGDMRIVFDDGGGEANALATALGLGSSQIYSREQNDVVSGTTAANLTAISVSAKATVDSYNFIDSSTSTVATRSTLLTNLRKTVGGSALITAAATNALVVTVNGAAVSTASASYAISATATIQGFIDTINADTDVNSKIQASFDDDTGQVIIRAISATATSVQIGISDDTATVAATADLGFGVRTLSASSADTTANYDMESIAFGKAAGALARIENDYNKIRDQIDGIVEDANYRGINLLGGDNLTSYFNEDRSNSLVTVGADLSASGLGINAALFSSSAAVDTVLEEILAAKDIVRDFGSTLSNDLSILQTRQDFTTSLINTLKSGASQLTKADENEEGANLLALQTRQQLGVTSLSLAAQSQQSVLRLF